MKSFVSGAPELPPPPYTWLITMSGEAARATEGRLPTGTEIEKIRRRTRA